MTRIDYSAISPFHREAKKSISEPIKSSEPRKPSVEPLLYSTGQAAELLGIGKTGVFQLIKEGRIKSVKVFSRRLISRQAIEDFIAELNEEKR